MNPVVQSFVIIIQYACKVADDVQKRVISVSCTPQAIMQRYDANCKIMLITTLRKPNNTLYENEGGESGTDRKGR